MDEILGWLTTWLEPPAGVLAHMADELSRLIADRPTMTA